MKITHVAEIVNITNVAGILEAEICGAENMRAVLMYNRFMYYQFMNKAISMSWRGLQIKEGI